MKDQIIHCFERAGLGKAPFQFVSFSIRRYCPVPGVSMVGGACAYCGTGIVECFEIKSADGKHFIVGNECIRKTDDTGLINLTKRELNRHRTEERHKREQTRIQEAKAALEAQDVRDKLAAQPHPYAEANPFFDGKTALDWAVWMMDHAGNAGRMQVAKTIARL